MFGWTTIKIIFSGVWKLIKPVVIMLVNDVKDEAIETAVMVVGTLAKSDLSSKTKRDKAFDSIKRELEKTGEEIKDSTVNLLIEVAVAKLKEDK